MNAIPEGQDTLCLSLVCESFLGGTHLQKRDTASSKVHKLQQGTSATGGGDTVSSKFYKLQ
jgi:hypothetical protein